MQGKPVVTRGSEYLGAVRDVLFDEESGRVLGFEVVYAEANGRPRRRTGVRADLASVVVRRGRLSPTPGRELTRERDFQRPLLAEEWTIWSAELPIAGHPTK